MIPYRTKSGKLAGTSLSEVTKQARKVFHEIEKRSKRKMCLRSAYFKKEKIFFDNFWPHLHQKSPKERFGRLKYFRAAIELIENSKNKPIEKQNPNKKSEIFHRFAGQTKEGELFVVQIKESCKTKKKQLMSIFPLE